MFDLKLIKRKYQIIRDIFVLKNTKEMLNEIDRIQCSLCYKVCIKKSIHARFPRVYLYLVHCRIIFALFCQEIYMMTILEAWKHFVNIVLSLKNRKCVSDYKLLFSFENLTEHLYLCYNCYELNIDFLKCFTC